MLGRFRDFFPKRRLSGNCVGAEPEAVPAAEAEAVLAAKAHPALTAGDPTSIDSAMHSGATMAAGANPPAMNSGATVAAGANPPANAPTGAGSGNGGDSETKAGAGASAAMGAPAQRTPAQRTGERGETAAAEFLAAKGHKVLERNWRAGRDEIDLITQDGVALVFVEVRTRAENALVGGFHSIDARKKAALRRVCGAYLKTCRPRPQTYRLDVVQIQMGKGGQMTIHHYAGIALFN